MKNKLFSLLFGLLFIPAILQAEIMSDSQLLDCQQLLGLARNGTDVCAIIENMDGTTSTSGMYDIGSDAPGGFVGANVGANITELTATSANAGSQIIAVEAATVGAVFDNCVNVEECLVELGGTGANEGTSIINLVAATGTACDTAADLDECIVSIIGATPSATNGANISGYDDSGNKTTTATVGDALDAIFVDLTTAEGFIPISITSLRTVDDITTPAVGNTVAIGGVHASDTHPAAGPSGTGSAALIWITANTCEPVMFQVPLPPDLNDAATTPITIHLVTTKTANADATTWDIACFINGGAAVAADTTVAFVQARTESVASILEANVPAASQDLTCAFKIEEEDGACSAYTDDVHLLSVWIEYQRKLHTQ